MGVNSVCCRSVWGGSTTIYFTAEGTLQEENSVSKKMQQVVVGLVTKGVNFFQLSNTWTGSSHLGSNDALQMQKRMHASLKLFCV